MRCPLPLSASCDSRARVSPGDPQVAGRTGSDRTGCGTSPYTQGPGHTQTLLWLWTDAHPSTQHPSVSAPASLFSLCGCLLLPLFFLQSVLSLCFPLFRSALRLFPLRHYRYAFPCLFISPSLCLQSSVSNTMPVTPGKLLGMWPPPLSSPKKASGNTGPGETPRNPSSERVFQTLGEACIPGPSQSRNLGPSLTQA